MDFALLLSAAELVTPVASSGHQTRQNSSAAAAAAAPPTQTQTTMAPAAKATKPKRASKKTTPANKGEKPKYVCEPCGKQWAGKSGLWYHQKRVHGAQLVNNVTGNTGKKTNKGGKCVHGRLQRRCKECGGSCICVHGRQRHQCRECGGTYVWRWAGFDSGARTHTRSPPHHTSSFLFARHDAQVFNSFTPHHRPTPPRATHSSLVAFIYRMRVV